MERNWLAGNPIVSIYRAQDHSIWVSTYGKGMYKYRRGQFIPLPLDANKNLLFTHCFVEDDNGFFWLPTNNGLFQCKKAELDSFAEKPGRTKVYFYLHKKAGAFTDEFNGGVGPPYVRFQHRILLPSMRGVLSFDPGAVQVLLPNKVILIENIVANGNVIKNKDKFVLPPGSKRLEVYVTAPYFGDAVNNILEYQLKEVADKWYPLTERAIIYNSLPKGTYCLTIRKRTGFGTGNYSFKEIRFSVRPYWYETVWAWLLAGCLITGMVYLVFRKRIHSLERSREQLEQKVAERTVKLETAVMELNLSEQELSRVNMVQEQALAVILHDIRSPLHYLAVSARNFHKNINMLPQEEIVAYVNSLVNSTSTIDKFSYDLVQWLRLNRDNHRLNNEAIELALLLENIRELYSEIAAMNNSTIEVRLAEPVRIVADQNKLYLIIRNLVDNATKHCKDGKITLSAQLDSTQQFVTISVADTGSGMSAEELRQWQEYTNSLPDFQKDKLGLSMVYYFVQLMKGKLFVDSEKNKGTWVRIILPI